MGSHIDGAVAGIVLAALYYLFFLNAWGSIPLACAMAFCACLLTGKLWNGLRARRRVSLVQARAELLRIATLPDDEAEAALTALAERRYPGQVRRLSPVLKHPEASMSSGDVLNAWKANRDADRLVVASTCPCEPRAALFARELRSPTVAVIDSRGFMCILRRLPAQSVPAAPRPCLRRRLRGLWACVAAARAMPRNALLAASLLALYLLSGNPWCLFSALALLAHLSIALFHGRVGARRLFEA